MRNVITRSVQLTLLLPMLLLLLLQLQPQSHQLTAAAAVAANGFEEPSLAEEPLLRHLLREDRDKLQRVLCCTGSLLSLRRVADAVLNFQTVFSDFLVAKGHKQLEQWEKDILRFSTEKKWSLLESTDFLWNPVNVYRFVRVIVREINPELLRFAKQNKGVHSMLEHLVSGADCWLGESSLTKAGENLLELRLLFNLTAEQLAAGKFRQHSAEQQLTIEELHELLVLLNRKLDDWQQVVELAQFLRNSPQLHELGAMRIRTVYRILAMALHRQHDSPSAVSVLEDHKSKYGNADARIDADLRYIRSNWREAPGEKQQQQLQQQQLLVRQQIFGLGDSYDSYMRTCAGMGDGEKARLSDPLLVCQLQRPQNGWRPFRKEILSRSPLVLLYHDAFADHGVAADELIVEAKRRAVEAVQEPDMKEEAAETGMTRIRLHSFRKPVNGMNSNITDKFIRRIQGITGLDASLHETSAEQFIEMTNFGHGLINGQQFNRRRQHFHSVAVSMFFPSKQHIGGELIFPEQGLRVPATRSNLVVWFDRMPYFYEDKNASTAFCPVMFGDYWTAAVALGQQYTSVDQDLMLETWQKGGTMRRWKSLTRPWPKRVAKEVVPETAAGNGSSSSSSSNSSNNSSNSSNANATDIGSVEGQANLTAAAEAASAPASVEADAAAKGAE